MELGLCLFHCEVQPDGAVRLDIAVLPGDTGPIQQERVEHFCVVADLTERFVLQQKPRKRHISGKCKEAKGILDAKKAETEKLAKELWQSVAFEDAENKLPEEQKVVSAEIAALDTALFEEEKKVSRRSELTESLPKAEKTLKERDKDISNRNTALEADRASLSEKKNQRNAA